MNKKKEYFSIPNIMGYFRIILVPVYLLVSYYITGMTGYVASALIIVISALTDFLDGKIARRFNMVTEWGKMLDPVADKITQGAVALSLAFRYPLMGRILIIFIIKEVCMAIAGIISIKLDRRMDGAQWYGKACTAVLYISMMLLLLLPGLPLMLVNILMYLCIVVMGMSILLYIFYYARVFSNKPGEIYVGKRKRPLTARIVIITTLVYIIFCFGCAVLSYIRHPDVSDKFKSELDVVSMINQTDSTDRAMIIDDNTDALDQRLRLIAGAQKEIMLSTFDFRSDISGSQIIAALIDAADRGVKVRIIVDGNAAFGKMENNPYFYVLSSHPNAEIKIYNKINMLMPWKLMGRMHDKIIMADNSVYIVGGRNTYDYFLGGQDGFKNSDRDVLVYNEAGNGSAIQIREYYDSLWNMKECTLFHNSESISGWSSVRRAATLLEDISIYRENTEYSYNDNTVPVDGVTLITNPIYTKVKEPQLLYTLAELMKLADEEVRIHTPYVICNEYMYSMLVDVCDSCQNVTMTTNSIANNSNPFGAMDYYYHKQDILDTGIRVLEYDGGVSYHGKSISIDKDISIIGSFNIDMRSAYLDTETMLVINGAEFNELLDNSLEIYEKDSIEALSNGEYSNPYNIECQTISREYSIKMKLVGIMRFLRYLF